MQEIWKDVKGYEGLYQVSNIGRIKRLRTETRDKRNRVRIKNEVILVQNTINSGRYLIQLSKHGKVERYLVHRLVATSFLPNPFNKKTVNHLNGNYQDNRVENLEWATHSENLKHAWDMGLR
jgi:hypothetical protein